jgi:hypothetical protein
MTMIDASSRRWRKLDSQADVETQVYVRRAQHPWGNVFLQPWRPTDPPPPWAIPMSASRAMRALASTIGDMAEETLARERPRRRSIVQWILVAAAFGIAFGIGRDDALRHELRSELRIATARATAVFETSAKRLGRQRD